MAIRNTLVYDSKDEVHCCFCWCIAFYFQSSLRTAAIPKQHLFEGPQYTQFNRLQNILGYPSSLLYTP